MTNINMPLNFELDGIEILDDMPSSIPYRVWNGNDSIYQHYFGKVDKEKECSLYLELNWGEEGNCSNRQLIGLYQINLPRLLENKYIRTEPKDSKDSSKVRLRFQRTNNKIEIAINRESKNILTVGFYPQNG